MNVRPSHAGTVKIDETTPSAYPATFSRESSISVQLEAIPASGYRFDKWSGHITETDNPTSVVVDCNKEITAHFSQITYTLTVRTSGSGSTIPAVGSYSYVEGTVVDIEAIPDGNWQFESWTGDVNAVDLAATTVTMSSDKVLIANFSQIKNNWWIVGSIAGVMIICVIMWFILRRRITK
ncbi:hypothetical protein ACFLVM_02100 [Chloroflexota bacterium]